MRLDLRPLTLVTQSPNHFQMSAQVCCSAQNKDEEHYLKEKKLPQKGAPWTNEFIYLIFVSNII